MDEAEVSNPNLMTKQTSIIHEHESRFLETAMWENELCGWLAAEIKAKDKRIQMLYLHGKY